MPAVLAGNDIGCVLGLPKSTSKRLCCRLGVQPLCPEFARGEDTDSGHAQTNVYGVVPTVPSCPDRLGAVSTFIALQNAGSDAINTCRAEFR
jgi:hypothetical protein